MSKSNYKILGQLIRFVRQRDAPIFFGVSRGYFNRYIRSSLTEIRWGDTPQSGVSFDLLEMNALADRIVERNGRPAEKGEISWDVKQSALNSLNGKSHPTSTLKERSSEQELGVALARHRKKKQP